MILRQFLHRGEVLMAALLTNLKVKNYRCLADLSLEMGGINVFFGPNGSGKSTILDTIWFFRDCAIRGVELASSVRNHGIGLLWDQAEDGAHIGVSLQTEYVEYDLRFGLSSGRIEPFPGERLRSLTSNTNQINRIVGADNASMFHASVNGVVSIPLREPDKLSLGLYVDFNPRDEQASNLDRLLHFVRLYPSRYFFLYRLKKEGSESSYETKLWERGDNLWSVLRNLHDRQASDDRYATIMNYMVESFPSFDGLRLEQTGPNTVYAHFRQKGRRKEIDASGVSDGHLQLLLLLTALFSEGRDRPGIVLFDEPETSLHPWPLAVLAKAVREAADNWDKQVLIATHSPVLLSQFDVHHVLSTQIEDGRTRVSRLSENEGIKDLLEQYSVGSLYMAEIIGGQRQPVAAMED
jgi:predicted ATPase